MKRHVSSSRARANKIMLNFMFSVPCIVIQLCNVDQQNALFKNNVLIHFFLSYTCFEHFMFIFRNTILYMQPYIVCFQCANAVLQTALLMMKFYVMSVADSNTECISNHHSV